MEHIAGYIGLGLLGLIAGSFAGAQVWRLRARQLVEDEAAGEKVDQGELKKLHGLASRSVRADRSQCLQCHHKLAWYDLIPIVSWVALGGKCRYCKKPIGWVEPLLEIGMAVFFTVSFAVWLPQLTTVAAVIAFACWLIVGVGLAILAIYDSKWFLLPNKVVFPLIGVALVGAIAQLSVAPAILPALVSLVGACVILSGIYAALYIVSRGRWIGFGDVKLGLILALSLGTWQRAFVALFLANIIGCAVLVPYMMRGKVSRKTQIPFGPFLIAGWLATGLIGSVIIGWYFYPL